MQPYLDSAGRALPRTITGKVGMAAYYKDSPAQAIDLSSVLLCPKCGALNTLRRDDHRAQRVIHCVSCGWRKYDQTEVVQDVSDIIRQETYHRAETNKANRKQAVYPRRVCAVKGCRVSFVPRSGDHIYCDSCVLRCMLADRESLTKQELQVRKSGQRRMGKKGEKP